MATRVRTRISFGAFANLKNNLQNQLGLNTLITNIKKLISTYNNNFAYIVNSFNAFLQFKSNINKYGIFINEEKNDNYLSSSDASTDYEEILNRITNIKSRLDVLESGNINKNYVDAEIQWYIKDFQQTDFNLNSSIAKLYINTIDGKKGISYMIAEKNQKVAAILFGTRYQKCYCVLQTNATDYTYFGITDRNYYTNDVKIISGMTASISFGPVAVISQTKYEQAIIGYANFAIAFSGKRNGKFPANWIRIDAKVSD